MNLYNFQAIFGKMNSKKRSNIKIKSSVFDAIFLSEKRKDILLFLKEEGPKSSDDIKDVFDFPWKSMTPQIKKLIDWGLVLEDDNKYTLSDMGSVIATSMQSFLNTLYLYEEHLTFWSDHDLSSIPFHMLSRIGELGSIEVIERSGSDFFLIPKELKGHLADSKRILSFSSVFYPSTPFLYHTVIEKNIEFICIFTRSVLEIMQTEYNDFLLESINNLINKKKFITYKQSVLDNKDSRFLMYEGESTPISLIVTDKIFFLSLVDKKGRFSTRSLIASESQALKWAEELFMYYKERSKPISLSSFLCDCTPL